MSAPQARDGDWLCAMCSNHNYASRTACNRCKQPRALVDSGVPVGGGGGGGGGAADPNRKEGEWTCGLCNNLNYAHRVQCNRCQTPKNMAMKPMGMPGAGMVPQDRRGLKRPSEGVGIDMQRKRLGNMCSVCGEANRPDCAQCAYCYSPLENAKRAAVWQCVMCQFGNPAAAPQCMKCFAPQNTAELIEAAKAMSHPWACATCSVVNLPAAPVCNCCGSRRTDGAGQQKAPGEWVCKACSSVNSAGTRECLTCLALSLGIKKESLQPLTEVWWCMTCGNASPPNSPQCKYCGGKTRALDENDLRALVVSASLSFSQASGGAGGAGGAGGGSGAGMGAAVGRGMGDMHGMPGHAGPHGMAPSDMFGGPGM
eukprot:CAMPEP_0177643134 /NCGR_PEP_ID=MMETSP0447-20121125/7993_1 /TAXON_ID=0 /ORGANISM="Stygamoeba regulata, Strain BSH-02190019" /LENGTH=368 /DNA_ID=CAMNT_0019145409 /DNA_START=51 /DNA_END=1154 /DNA_ORIENTATION=+